MLNLIFITGTFVFILICIFVFVSISIFSLMSIYIFILTCRPDNKWPDMSLSAVFSWFRSGSVA
jgi:energy-coupling factor transporter transmembrane protein EcfT